MAGGEPIRPFSRQYWLERRRLHAMADERRRRVWFVIVFAVLLVFGAVLFTVSITGGPDSDEESVIITGQ